MQSTLDMQNKLSLMKEAMTRNAADKIKASGSDKGLTLFEKKLVLEAEPKGFGLEEEEDGLNYY